jgi:hypothetical protein
VRQRAKKREAPKTPPETLKGWQQIAAFLGEPTSVVQRWASDGMPVRKQGPYVETTPEELNTWLGKESGKPVPCRNGGYGPNRRIKAGTLVCAAEEVVEIDTEGEVIT